MKNGRSAYFVQQNRGKKSLCLNFDKPGAIELLRELVKKVDVVVENYGPGVLEKKKLDYASLRAINPRIIMASVSAFGRTGPMSHKVGFDIVAQAYSGLMHMTGYPDRPPVFVGMAIGDQGAGIHAFAALGYALFHRERTGVGQAIDIAMVDVLFHQHELNLQAYVMTDGQYVPLRSGAHHPLITPMGVFEGPQGYIVVLVVDRQWPALAKAIGRPELATDPRYATGAERAERRDELVEIIQAWMKTFPTDDAVLEALERARIAAAPVMTIERSLEAPHFREREMIRRVPDPVLGEITMPGFPFKFSELGALPDLRAPLLGEHGEAVLRDHLGLGDAELARLCEAGVLHSANV
jgi:CoA:oxalate CoA-transferase